MAALLQITVDDPQDVIDTYGTGARIYVNRGTTAAVADSSFLTSILVVATTTAYEHADADGTPGTDRYFIRFGTAAPVDDDDYGAWSSPIVAGDAGGRVLTLETAKRWVELTDTVDDPWLPIGIGAMNRAIIRGIGVDIGPSPDTTRYYDGRDAVRNGTRLWIPGGIRAFLTVAVSTDGGSTFTAVTNDVRIGPNAHSRAAGEPGAYIEFKSTAAITGSYSRFPDGTDNVRITATAFEGFGWSAYPDDLVQMAAAAFQRMFGDRNRDNPAYPNETDAARYLNLATIRYYRDMYSAAAR